ncbi:winged helix-turn-helix domain-containing protein [Zunongwangia sp. F260]|uniref:Winged helix-turn-helix domain-containing protein n=1 Tax=Autumnicola lenta TaxID=3075593 RepID=A0ABU3CHA1_9FLAO|nr:winged helix-turn-helix domain-containing protein [Zunongwangia sp. F260]MDT0645671.1 winged helix-turn-helix domain-containing protein [Zunongwangia sp. F260]
MKKIRFKCWVEDEGEKFYGPGPNELIRQIQKEGSLSKAAGQMKMSYKKAWDLVQRLNTNSDEPWVIMKKGGQHGGGAQVTPHAIKAMQEYEKLQEKMRNLLEQQEDLIKVF